MTPGKKQIESNSASTVFWLIVGGTFVIGVGLYNSQMANQERLFVVAIGAGLVIWGWRAVDDPRLALRYAWSRSGTVSTLIKEWSPPSCRLESEYEKSLHEFLKSKLGFAKITRQYGSARVKCDLAVANGVMIELKTGLRSTNKLQRLLGQIELYRSEWKKPLKIVLLGDSQEDLLHDLNRSIQKYDYIEVISKSVVEPVESEERQSKASA